MDFNFEELYHRYFNKVYRTAFLITSDHQLAEDATQEAFLKAFAKIDTLNNPGKFGSWVSVIASNYSIDLLRKNKRLTFTEQSDHIPDAPQENPADICEHHEDMEEIKKALCLLDDKDRQLLVLKYFNEMSIKEIAAMNSVSQGTIKSRLFRAREKIKELLQPYDKEKRQLSKSKA